MLTYRLIFAAASQRYLSSVAQIANLPYRRLQIGRALAVFRRPGQGVVLQDGILRYSAARRSCNQNGPRLWSKTQPQRVGIAAMLRLVLRTQPRSENSSRLATILGDTDRLEVCTTTELHATRCSSANLQAGRTAAR